jgi:hypothetical protein
MKINEIIINEGWLYDIFNNASKKYREYRWLHGGAEKYHETTADFAKQINDLVGNFTKQYDKSDATTQQELTNNLKSSLNQILEKNPASYGQVSKALSYVDNYPKQAALAAQQQADQQQAAQQQAAQAKADRIKAAQMKAAQSSPTGFSKISASFANAANRSNQQPGKNQVAETVLTQQQQAIRQQQTATQQNIAKDRTERAKANAERNPTEPNLNALAQNYRDQRKILGPQAQAELDEKMQLAVQQIAPPNEKTKRIYNTMSAATQDATTQADAPGEPV